MDQLLHLKGKWARAGQGGTPKGRPPMSGRNLQGELGVQSSLCPHLCPPLSWDEKCSDQRGSKPEATFTICLGDFPVSCSCAQNCVRIFLWALGLIPCPVSLFYWEQNRGPEDGKGPAQDILVCPCQKTRNVVIMIFHFPNEKLREHQHMCICGGGGGNSSILRFVTASKEQNLFKVNLLLPFV